MELYHRLYLVCLWGMGVCAAASAVLFVRLDIRSVLRVLAGAPAKERIKKKEMAVRRCRNRTAEEQGTVVLNRGESGFHVEREVMVTHAEQTEVWGTVKQRLPRP